MILKRIVFSYGMNSTSSTSHPLKNVLGASDLVSKSVPVPLLYTLTLSPSFKYTEEERETLMPYALIMDEASAEVKAAFSTLLSTYVTLKRICN